MIIREEISDVWITLKTELRGKTLALAFGIAIAFIFIVGLLPNLSLLWNTVASDSPVTIVRILVGLVYGIFVASPWWGVLLLILLGLLTGMNVALTVSRARRARRAGVTGVGSFFGLLLGGCPSCATGVLPALGLAGTLSFLPLGGTEFALLGVFILLVTLYWNATAERCRI